MTIGERIKQRRIELGFSADYVAERLGINRTTVFRYERGAITKVNHEVLAKLASILHTSPVYLMGLSDELGQVVNIDNIFQIETKRFPLLGTIACGEPILAAEDFEAYVEAGASIRADFCLKCKGDSMINARIQDGDIVFIRKQSTVDNGEIAAVIIDDEATLKRIYYYPDKKKLILQAENPSYEPFVYIGEELNQVRVLGKAIAFQSDIE
ncbi:MAG: helix-turn-helix domain-containing protein [Streptococcaceae bacterium]|jgi:repressor LexA|nr:helix-turn-helix domain-containing protein [Streptococcaceae bacterium]